MNPFDNIQSLVNRLKELSTTLASSKLSESELQEFESLARSLYERTLILNYKAKEERVYEKSVAPKEKEVVNKIVTETETKKEEVEVPVKEETIQSPKSSSEIQFDFSNDFENTPKESLKTSPKEAKNENKTVAPEVEDTTSQEDSDLIDELYVHFSKAYKIANNDKLGHAKIQTLKGAFGLNDKLLFIRELFNNDTGDFNKTVEVLDSYQNTEDALKKLSEIAVSKQWKKEDTAVNDFLHMVNRRYVQ